MMQCTTAESNTLCVPEHWICEKYILCQEYRDEDCSVLLSGCDPSQFWCHLNETCIPRGVVCDGVVDCGGMEDEAGCAGELTCGNSRQNLGSRLACGLSYDL